MQAFYQQRVKNSQLLTRLKEELTICRHFMFIIIWKDKLLIINQKANFNSGSALKFIYFYKNIVIQGKRTE